MTKFNLVPRVGRSSFEAPNTCSRRNAFFLIETLLFYWVLLVLGKVSSHLSSWLLFLVWLGCLVCWQSQTPDWCFSTFLAFLILHRSVYSELLLGLPYLKPNNLRYGVTESVRSPLKIPIKRPRRGLGLTRMCQVQVYYFFSILAFLHKSEVETPKYTLTNKLGNSNLQTLLSLKIGLVVGHRIK